MLVEVPRTGIDTVGMCRGKISSLFFFGLVFILKVLKCEFICVLLYYF